MGKLIMLSVFHDDPKGKKRLLKMLKRFKPNIITVENSAEMSEYFKSERFKMFNRQIRNILETRGLSEKELLLFDSRTKSIAVIFEVQATQEYCKDIIPFYLIDLWDEQEIINYEMTGIKSAKNSSIHGIADAFNLENLGEEIDSRYRQFMLFVQRIGNGDTDVGRRDKFMETRLREILEENPDKTIVHIGGAKHSINDSRTLYSKIKDLNPQKHLLIEADNNV